MAPTLACVDFRYEKSQKFGFFRKLWRNEAVCSKSRNEPQIFGQIHFLFFLPAVGFYGFAPCAKPPSRGAKPRGNISEKVEKF
ncbi:MAG: hypothetical protein A3A28_03450 [Candidatus Sungbacteria bacterium RIFCSPLOWO2_01_FULL_47_32]|uniref:Uncharacterized protein n=1 Tax=Candidatus Sungbacteria bacterium RIFCSPHIGHO2_01_FULL_47_32 TaxID=1802264 RepID=A0A1G2K550_9BACT|nr:MAG: hypothetical protein A2633_03530 [Candidatus Sungbacteria bacterium RIFCSPHIGHO2_01_FULL_47_32]OHA04993.1 MAG: hypothetical protein A3A28_03450 [Candidatus Sungbacteria bacterium RIFCSPLOWO2_01_FULL_47_32]